MKLVKVYGCALYGLEGITVTIEVSISEGFKYLMVGLPDSAVKESWQRVEAAIRAAGYQMPRRKVVINLAPADIKKEGSAYDLPIAIGILVASEQVTPALPLEQMLIMGELSLDGLLRPVRGGLPIAMHARDNGFPLVVLPAGNAPEAGIVEGVDVFGFGSLRDVVDFIENRKGSTPYKTKLHDLLHEHSQTIIDLSDIKGQQFAKRALEVAAAGRHNLLMIGPPGAGKTLLARALVSILPPMSLEEALITTKIHSVAGLLTEEHPLVTVRPFRSPHHTISDVALVGGGVPPMPGEVSLAHNGVLFLDELPEFRRSVLEVLRQPLEERTVTISRAKFTVTYPADFMLVTAMNPCPCGWYGHPEKECACSPGMIQRYLSRVSGPLLDRIDIHVEVPAVSFEELRGKDGGETSAQVRERVIKAWQIQTQRFREFKGVYFNSQMSPRLVRQFCQLDREGEALLKAAMERLALSARAHDRILKVARTIADLAGSEHIKAEHIAEAVSYRSLDKYYSRWVGTI